MRVLLAVLLFAPLSGCLGGTGLIDSELFDYITVERGDPTPLALDDCATLLETLNVRAEQRALVNLHQSYENAYYRGPMVDFAMEDSADGATAPAAAAPSDRAHGASPEFTGTNNQEADVDEADSLKTDGTYTYVVQQNILYIMRSDGLGNLTLHSVTELGNDYAYGTQILLVNRGTADLGDDRLVLVRPNVQLPQEVQEEKKEEESSDSEDSIIADIAYWGGAYTNIQVYDLGDRRNPDLFQEHYIEGDNVGARLVDGVAHLVIHQYEPYLGLRDWAGPDDDLLKAEGLTWDEYYQLSEPQQRPVLRKAVEDAIADNKKILANLELHDHLPTIYRSTSGGLQEVPYSSAMCRNVLTTPDDTGRAVSTILSIDADEVGAPYKTVQIMGGRPIVYGANDALVLASSSNEFWWFWAQPELEEATNLHWFDLNGIDVTHRASGRVVGIVQDQFGIDVHNGQLRVATTTGTWGRWWVEDPLPMMNHLFVFQEVAGQLLPQGSVTGFALEERIWSARFTDDRAYIVTFRQIDPLWIIDLTDPSNPTILGELEIPGVSTYIHPLPGEQELLTIGFGPRAGSPDDPEGRLEGLDFSRIQVSLFDISDPSTPTRADVYDVTLPGDESDGWSWSYSAAVYEHKAFTYWDKLGMLAVPVTWHHSEEYFEDGKRYYVEEFHTGLELINVDRTGGSLSKHGAVDQDHLMDDEGYYWGAEVERSYFIGFPDDYPDQPVSVVAMSSIGISSHDLETLANQDAVHFDRQVDYDPCRGQDVICAVDDTAFTAVQTVPTIPT